MSFCNALRSANAQGGLDLFMVTRAVAMGTRLYVSAIIVVLAFQMMKARGRTD